jgi:hypothetical protein
MEEAGDVLEWMAMLAAVQDGAAEGAETALVVTFFSSVDHEVHPYALRDKFGHDVQQPSLNATTIGATDYLQDVHG